MNRFADIHTHNLNAGPDAIICIDPSESPVPGLRPDRFYSVGIHPWRAHLASAHVWERLEKMSVLPNVVAIGEAGLDRLRGPAHDVQMQAFLKQARLAEKIGKPLIIHAVRSNSELISLIRAEHPSVPWIIHGFRGKPELAAQLAAHGFHLSLGPRFNPGVIARIPSARLHRETDAPR